MDPLQSVRSDGLKHRNTTAMPSSLTLLLSLLFALLLTGCSGPAAGETDLAITGVNLIDGTGNPMVEYVDIFIEEGKISRIVPAGRGTPAARQVVEAEGLYAIPGLIEAHAHPSSVAVDTALRNERNHRFRTMIHYGITTAFVPGGSSGTYPAMRELRRSAAESTLISPRIFFSSPFFTIRGGHPMKTYPSGNWVEGKTYYDLSDTSKIGGWVEQAVANQAAGIKLIIEDGPTPPFIERLDSSTIRKVVVESHRRNLPVFTHVSDIEEVRLGIEAGVDHFVHFAGVRIDWEQDRELIDRFAERGGSWITTLMLAKSLIYYRLNPDWLERPEIAGVYDSSLVASLRYPGMREEGMAILRGWTGSEEPIPLKTMITPMVRDLQKIREAGVNVVLGTDVGGDRYILGGLSLHEEMQMMQMGGFDPLTVIRMATLNGAKMLGIEETFGSLEEGKYADLVLLRDNPLEDIRNTLSIEKVFRGGIEQPRIKAAAAGRSE